MDREQEIDAIMRAHGYACRKDAEWHYREAHGEPLGCINMTPIDTIEELVAAYGEQALHHPIERVRFGLPPLTEAESQPAASPA